ARSFTVNTLRSAVKRVAKTAPSGQLQANGAARRHGLASLGPDRTAGAQRHDAGSTNSAAATPTWRMAHALEIAKKRQRIGSGAAELDDLAESAAELPRAAGAVAEFPAIEHDRRDAFGGFHRNRTHAGGKSGSAQSVLLRPRAGAAAVK